MKWIRIAAVLAVAACPAIAQLDSNSLTVTATRSTALLPDQVVISVSVLTRLTAIITLDKVLSGLSGTGIRASDLTGITQYVEMNLSPTIYWNFRFRAPLAGIQTTLAALATAPPQDLTWSVSFYVQALEVSVKAMPADPCSPPDLLKDAQARAQTMADAAGLGLGPVLAMSDGSSVPAGYANSFAAPSLVIGAFVNTTSFISSTPALSSCSMTVKFQLLRYN